MLRRVAETGEAPPTYLRRQRCCDGTEFPSEITTGIFTWQGRPVLHGPDARRGRRCSRRGRGMPKPLHGPGLFVR